MSGLFDGCALIQSLVGLPRETEWVEFKKNRFDENEIGQYVSGLANSAMLHEKDRAYLVFGVEDATHAIIGTDIGLKDRKIGNEIFEAWLTRLVHPAIHFRFEEILIDNKKVEIIVIDPGYMYPVRFKSFAFIRVNSINTELRHHPERERALWQITSRIAFENGVLKTHFSPASIFENFEVDELLSILEVKRNSQEAKLEYLAQEGLIYDDLQGGFDITNLLALVSAKRLSQVGVLSNKSPRVIRYKDTTKLFGIDDHTGQKGYASAFEAMLRYIMERIGHKEVMLNGKRSVAYEIPAIAIREFVANALVHQDLTMNGSSLKIEIFFLIVSKSRILAFL